MKEERYSVGCVIKLLTTTNRVRHIRVNTKPNSHYFLSSS